MILLTPDRYELVRTHWHACRSSGKPWVNIFMVNNLVREIQRHARQAELKLKGKLNVHSFRKSSGQNWANHLPMNVVKELMGHASITTTAEYYSTVSEEHQAKARWVIEVVAMGVGEDKTDAKLTSEAILPSNLKAS